VTPPWDLTGAIAVVTGALGRLGPIWSTALLEAGAVVVGLDLPEAKISDPFAELMDRYPRPRLHLVRADVSDRRSVEEARDRCVRDLGCPTVLVNNAGIDQPPAVLPRTYRIEDLPVEAWLPVLGVNVLGTFLMIQVIGGEMRRERRGSIVNIGSLYASVAPDPRLYDHLPSDPPFLKPPAYGASKAAVVNLTAYFAALWGPDGVRVNALSPGGVLGGQDAEFVAKYSVRVPMRRMAQPEDLAGPLVFLASDASRYVTGVDLRVDGGFTIW
jgi:NAD(P)-dependent dehydrogenase (short-subunit alcohol dehydrogenase family)